MGELQFEVKIILSIIISLFVSGVIVYGANTDIKTFPIIKLLTKHEIFSPLELKAPQTKTTQKQATRAGAITGFEPRTLEKVPYIKMECMYGDPGFGLNNSNFSDKAIKLGTEGELNFAKVLQWTGLITRFKSFWSVGMPSRNILAQRMVNFESDIDCILFNGRTVWLVDLKNYKSGNLEYRNYGSRLRGVDLDTGSTVVDREMSQNMKMADEIFRNHCNKLGYIVKSRVVFMPTNLGAAKLNKVYWPGRIPAVNLTDFLQEISNEPQIPADLKSSFISDVYKLLK